jgi:hypothetical protein
MNSTAPTSFSNGQGVSDPPSTREQPALQPAQATLPHVSEADLGCDPQPTPRELHEEQIQFLALVLDNEVMNHNTTRDRLHRYLNLYMKQEREGCSERVHTQYLNEVIKNLRAQLKQEQVRRLALEGEKAALLQESFDNFTCVGPPDHLSRFNADSIGRIILQGQSRRASREAHQTPSFWAVQSSPDKHKPSQTTTMKGKEPARQTHIPRSRFSVPQTKPTMLRLFLSSSGRHLLGQVRRGSRLMMMNCPIPCKRTQEQDATSAGIV